ncbi:MAG: hydrogenase maturation protease [Thermodesulfovibrionales bacterium]|nr:hydrogenase maturation protease [Thermodesulfovibrionales bacterium]
MTKQKVAVVGYGNDLRGDDGIGIVAVRKIREFIKDTNVDTYEYHQLSIEVLPLLCRYDKIIFIDCSTDIAHAEVRCYQIQPDNNITLTMTHHLMPEQILQLIETLYNKTPIVYVCKIGGRVFDFGCEISQEVLASTPKIIKCCMELIENTVQ